MRSKRDETYDERMHRRIATRRADRHTIYDLTTDGSTNDDPPEFDSVSSDEFPDKVEVRAARHRNELRRRLKRTQAVA